MTATVINIIDGDTFDIQPGWVWGSIKGTRIRPAGYDAAELGTLGGMLAKQKLMNLLHRKTVKLGQPYKVDRGRLVCEVFLEGRNLASYLK